METGLNMYNLFCHMISMYQPTNLLPLPPPKIDFNCYTRPKSSLGNYWTDCDYFKDGQLITRRMVSFDSNAKELNMYGDMPYPIELNIAVE